MLPLPNSKELLTGRNGYNRGLVWTKFCGQWPSNTRLGEFKGLGGQEKKLWIKIFEGETADGASECDRIKKLAKALNGKTVNYTTTGPFVTGMGLSNPIENGFLWHHTLGVPYLPGSSIKGMIRAWATEWCQEENELTEEIARLFGRDTKDDGGAAGNIIVFDALPTEPVSLYAEVITPHTGDWRITKTPENSPPADWVSPVPIPFLAVREGAQFQFAMALRTAPTAKGKSGPDQGDLARAYKYLEEALEWIGAGAKTAVGFGRFKSDDRLKQEEAEAAELKKQKKLEWNAGLKGGDEANYFGQRVQLRDVDHVEGKAGLVNIEKGKSLGRKSINKLKPWV